MFKENDDGNFFYIVKSGEFVLTFDSENFRLPKTFKTGDTFGEIALIQKNKRTGTVRCTEDAEVFCLEGNMFRDILLRLNKEDLNDRLYFLTLTPIFKGLESVQLSNLANSINRCTFKAGYVIISQGDTGESMYIIREGFVSCIKDGMVVRKLGPKDYFGESSLLFDERRSLSVVATSNVTCYQVSKSSLLETLGPDFKIILFMGICKGSFLASEILKNFVFDQIFLKMFSTLKLGFYKQNDTVVSIKDDYVKIIVLLEGNMMNV